MKKILICAGVVLLVLMGLVPGACAEGGKLRIFVVSSYHREYLWTQDTNKGLCAAFKDFKFLDSDAEVEEFTKNDAIETATVVIKKAWMDTKRKNKKEEIAATTTSIMAEINAFKPDILYVGITAPKQEKWVFKHKDRIDAHLIASIGAVFDFYAGTVPRPEKFWLWMNLEWFIRLLREPRRLWRRSFISGPSFFKDIFLAKIGLYKYVPEKDSNKEGSATNTEQEERITSKNPLL